MMFKAICPYMRKPALYEKSTSKFWDDPYISQNMLKSHLDPAWDGATRNIKFVNKSVDWIASVLPPERYPELLDLGCGPGIYTERFYQKSYRVTGIDLSERSIGYAKENAQKQKISVDYSVQDYLVLDTEKSFDVVTLIYCDLGVLSKENRSRLLHHIHRVLKPGGAFIFDVFTPRYHEGEPERKWWEYCDSGFYCDKPHICLHSFYRYDEDGTVLTQAVVMGDDSVHCYNLWENTFTADELKSELRGAGFSPIELYGDIAGAEYDPNGEMICVIAKKEENKHGLNECNKEQKVCPQIQKYAHCGIRDSSDAGGSETGSVRR